MERDYKSRRLRAWELQAHDWDEYTKENVFHVKSHQRMCSEVLSLRGPNTTALTDFGCGSGRFVQMLKEKSTSPWNKLVGIDFCHKMLNLAKQLDTNYTNKVDWHWADLELPINQSAIYSFTGFDIATAIFLLDEVEDIAACFASARSVLRPGGYFLCGMLDADRERERYKLPTASGQVFTVIRPIVISGQRVPGEYYRIVRSREQIYAAAPSAGLALHGDKVLPPADLEAPREGPALRIAAWRKSEARLNR